MNIQALLSNKISQALVKAGASVGTAAQVRQSTKIQFGDYQANGVMNAAKILAIPPRLFAEKVIGQLDLGDMVSKVEIAGPGFINLFLNSNWLAQQIEITYADKKLNITPAKKQTIVVDYSGPNVAKEMHVGHLRSTIIGDAMVRSLMLLGHKVIRANHLGDWGTQFGMLIAYLEKMENEHAKNMELADLEDFYRQAKQFYDENSTFAEQARSYVVKLQSGDQYCQTMWRKLIHITMKQNQINYQRLNVTLTEEDIMGESLYNSMLPAIVSDLKTKGLAVESDGATVVFLDQCKNKAGEPMGVIIQKKDGGYLYSTTDIACAKYRYETLGADRVLYYVDSRQHQHLTQAWAIARQAGYIPDSVSLEHHMFGMMLGKDAKPFKTRSGKTIKLSYLLDEAIERTGKLKSMILAKNPDMSNNELDKVINMIAIGAVKYADLSKNRTTDYIFDWDNMLALDGNTAPYIQYAYTRISSIFRKAGLAQNQLTGTVFLQESYEKALAVCLLQFDETLHAVASEGSPHLMCGYLYQLAGLFSSFYEKCPILTTHNEHISQSRLKLAALTARTIKQGLDTLGIETVERM